MGSLLSIALCRLEPISFSATAGNKLPWQHFFMFLGLSLSSLHSKSLHGLEVISFSMIPGNKSCHGNTFFLFLRLMNLFMGSLLSIPLRRLELISFSSTPDNKCCHGNTLCFLGLKIFLGVLYIPNPCIHWS